MLEEFGTMEIDISHLHAPCVHILHTSIIACTATIILFTTTCKIILVLKCYICGRIIITMQIIHVTERYSNYFVM